MTLGPSWSGSLGEPTGPGCVHLRRTEHTIVLDVADEDPETGPRRAGPRPPAAGGLGLRIVDELVGDLGWYVDAAAKHVWAEFPIPRSGSTTGR